jgi:hypothetical protein
MNKNNLLMIISYLRRGIGFWRLVGLIETGQVAEVFSTTKKKPF